VLSFVGFELWIEKHPSVFVNLWKLLLPLLPCSVALLGEELELASKQMSQRGGELRATMEVQKQRKQRKLMAKFHTNFTERHAQYMVRQSITLNS